MSFQDLIFVVVLPILGLAVLLTFARLLKGPSMPDRIVALDLITTIGIIVIVVFAIASDQSIYLDVAIVLAFIAFLGTVAFSFYVEKRS